jgi:hypothetical protein
MNGWIGAYGLVPGWRSGQKKNETIKKRSPPINLAVCQGMKRKTIERAL